LFEVKNKSGQCRGQGGRSRGASGGYGHRAREVEALSGRTTPPGRRRVPRHEALIGQELQRKIRFSNGEEKKNPSMAEELESRGGG